MMRNALTVDASPSPLPELNALRRGLASVLGAGADDGRGVTVLDRERHPYEGTFPTEIVTCRTGDRELRLLCKYTPVLSSDLATHLRYGDRRGVVYEAEVYQRVLRPSQASVPKFYGTYADPGTGRICLVLEYLDNCGRVNTADGLIHAARWLGRFHAANEGAPTPPLASCLKVYDTAYYLGWARRTSLFAGTQHERFPWLGSLCERFGELTAALTASPSTVIHGEFYPLNVLVRGSAVYPVDWESAAIAAGEVDLAALTEGWPTDVAKECEREYQWTRWPSGPPASLSRALGAARMYSQLRRLGERPEWTAHPGSRWRFEQLRSAAAQLDQVSI